MAFMKALLVDGSDRGHTRKFSSRKCAYQSTLNCRHCLKITVNCNGKDERRSRWLRRKAGGLELIYRCGMTTGGWEGRKFFGKGSRSLEKVDGISSHDTISQESAQLSRTWLHIFRRGNSLRWEGWIRVVGKRELACFIREDVIGCVTWGFGSRSGERIDFVLQ